LASGVEEGGEPLAYPGEVRHDRVT
jgi:hypothetical protein